MAQLLTFRLTLTFLVFIFSIGAVAQTCPGSPGCLDPAFGSGGIIVTSVNFNTASGWANAVAIQADAKIVVAAESANYENTSAWDFYVLRFLSDGSLDPSFGNGGVVRSAFTSAADHEAPSALAIQPDGKILVAGAAGADSTCVARLNPDGTFDNTFGTNGKLIFKFMTRTWGGPNAMIVQTDGRIAIGLNAQNTGFGFVCLNSNGSFDTSFNGSGKLYVETAKKNSTGALIDMVIQPDGKYLASGGGAGTSNVPTFMLMRVNPNGTLDSSFGSAGKVITNFGGTWSYARNVKLDSAGNIVVGGDWLTSTGQSFVFTRYLSNGQLDTMFGSNGKAIFSSTHFRRMLGMAIQADGKIVGSGWDHDATSTKANVSILRVLSNGLMDPTFGSGGITITDYNGMSDQGSDMAVQSDGKFVVAGVINGFGAGTSIGLFRYLP